MCEGGGESCVVLKCTIVIQIMGREGRGYPQLCHGMWVGEKDLVINSVD